MKLSEISIRRPVFATVMSLLLVLVGAVSFLDLQLREYPRIDEPVVNVSTRLTGASSEVIESQQGRGARPPQSGRQDRQCRSARQPWTGIEDMGQIGAEGVGIDGIHQDVAEDQHPREAAGEAVLVDLSEKGKRPAAFAVVIGKLRIGVARREGHQPGD